MPEEVMTGYPLAPSVQLPLLPSGPGGVHGLQSRRPGHHAFWRKLFFSPSSVWRKEWDSNPRYVAAHSLSKRAPSSTRPSLLITLPICPFSNLLPKKSGEGGIRTHGGREPTVDFESTAFVHSATPPQSFRGFFRLSRKKPLRSSELSSAKTPSTTSK